MKIKLILPIFYMCTDSLCSKELANSLNSSKFKAFLIISTKLEGLKQSISGSFV
jgi:hypothetical protein